MLPRRPDFENADEYIERVTAALQAGVPEWEPRTRDELAALHATYPELAKRYTPSKWDRCKMRLPAHVTRPNEQFGETLQERFLATLLHDDGFRLAFRRILENGGSRSGF